MPLRDIVVYLDREPGCTARFMAAIELARRHRACLKGLCAISHPYYAPNSDHERDYGEMRSFFMNAASKAGVMAQWLYADWNVVGVDISDIITLHAYHTDLLIIGQPIEAGSSAAVNRRLPERLILGTGRPVVVLPSDGDTYQFGSKVMVAWKGGRESVRAIHDALPLLEKSSPVLIVAAVSGGAQRDREAEGLSALQEHLDRHGIQASIAIVDCGKRTVADVLLQRVKEEEADLLVMGGYTQGPRGPVFGKLSRELISRMTVPILFSH